MEKLQNALHKARQQREGQPTSNRAPATPRARKSSKASDSVDTLWEELTPITPPAEALKRHRLVTQSASAEATPFDILRTKILLQMRQNNWTRLAITSPTPDSGKSTIACNLALGLGRQPSLRTMLFDLDLSSPSISSLFEVSPEHSISEVLMQDVPFSEQGYRIGNNLAVGMSGHHESDPTRILLAQQTEASLDEIEAAYKPDIVIFDLPSVLHGDDTRAFLKNADCALIVTRAHATRYSQFDITEREIAEHTNVLGVVVNACRFHGND